MGYFPGRMKPEQPGVNGVRYAMVTNHVYYTATAKKLFMRVAVDPDTLAAEGEPELVVAGRMGDDFCIDESAGVIYLATHRQNTFDVVSMEPGLNSGFTQCVAGRSVHRTADRSKRRRLGPQTRPARPDRVFPYRWRHRLAATHGPANGQTASG